MCIAIYAKLFANFFSCSSMPRNRELMRVFKDVGLVEQLGSGMSRILKAYDKSIFQISDHFIKAVFPLAKALDMENTASGNINGSKSGGINGNNEEYSIKIMDFMKELRENGKVIRIGSTRKGTWHINE